MHCNVVALTVAFGQAPCNKITFSGPKREHENLGETITKPLKQRKQITRLKKKWIDDLSMLASIDLKKSLKVDYDETGN